jgi:7,8-dihydro-6-hydroxymethylpterin-pyrophosphokinase
MHERAFVLVPLAEIAPDVMYPGREETIAKLAAVVGAEGVRRIKEAGWDGVAATQERVRL